MKKTHIILVAISCSLLSHAQIVIDDNMESYTLGQTNLPNASLENCEAWSQCNSPAECPTSPLIISSKQARDGDQSLRFEFNKNNWILHGDGYCALRNEIRYDVNLKYEKECWYGFSVFPTLNEDSSVKYNSDGDSWICQIKNECGSGNIAGVQIRGDVFKNSKNGKTLGTVNYNEWNDIVLHYTYSEDGFLEYWVNDEYHVENKSESSDNCKIDFKIGCYGWHPLGKTILYFDAIKIKKGKGYYEEVVPGFVCLDEKAPSKPEDFTATATKQVTLAWNDVSENENGFIIERKTEGGTYKQIDFLYENENQYIDDQVIDGNTYYYRLASFNCKDTSGYTGEINVHLEKDNTIILKANKITASNYLGNYKPENTMDSSLTTYWLSEGTGEWVQYHLENPAEVTRLDISFIDGDKTKYKFKVKLSMDSTRWLYINEFNSSGLTNRLKEYDVPDTRCKYIQFETVTGSKNNRNWLSEVVLRGNLLSGTRSTYPSNKFSITQDHDNINILTNSKSGIVYKVDIYDVLGKKIHSGLMPFNQYQIHNEQVMPGFYIFQFTNKDERHTSKIYLE